MRRFATFLVLAAAVVGAVVLTGASGGGDGGVAKYKIQFDNAFGLTEGGDFRIGGVDAGQTTAFKVVKAEGRPVAQVDVEVNQKGFGDLRMDASCEIRPQSLIGEYYVDCQPGTSSNRLPTDGSGTVPVEQNAATIPQDLVTDIMRRPYRERFRLILSELGAGLAGRPQDLAEVLRRAHPGLRETTRVLKILADQNDVIEHFIVDSDTVVNQLEQNKKDVARWVTASADSAEVSASRGRQISETFHKLPGFLDELRPTMHALGNLADQQTPLLVDLKKAAPDLNEFFHRLGPFSKASLPALESLGESSKAGTRAFQHGGEEVAQLKELSKDAPGFAKPLRQFLQTMDDRRRALESDPRAKATAPPSPDPTAIPDNANFKGLAPKGGFTGVEGLWDYIYWQTLSINGADSVGHIVRLGLTAVEGCSDLRNKGPEPGNASDKALFDKCNSYIGPNQPGINSPDFTLGGASAQASAAQDADARGNGKLTRRSAGQPEAPPIPGKRDLSKPQITLPPLVRELIQKLAPDKLPGDLPQRLQQIPPQDQPSPETLLDFLLSP